MTITTDNIRIEGNSIIMKLQPATGLLALTSFISEEQGASESAYFEKYFRYSLNGVIFNEWQALTALAVTNLTISTNDILVIELQYFKREPLGESSVLSVTSVEIEALQENTPSLQYFDNTIFKKFFNSDSIEVLRWYVNVLDKLYQRGIIPNYIDRLNDFESPDDFLAFWRSIAKFFSFFVAYARKVQNFYESESLLSEYLEERGIKTSIENSLVELNALMNSFYEQMARRGTISIVDDKIQGDLLDGELLRLVWYKGEEDEFLFNLHKPEHFGWNVSNSSPLYKGLHLNDNLNKFGDKSYEPYDISLYPSGAEIIDDEDKKVLQISGVWGEFSHKMKVSSDVDYEFSFLIKKEAIATLTVRLQAYDKDLNLINLKSYRDGSLKNDFFTNIGLSRDDKYLLVRMFLYNKSKGTLLTDQTTIHQGTNLVSSNNVVWIVPFIEIDGGSALICGTRFLPSNTSYSHGLIQVNNWISCWLKNRNHSLTTKTIEDFIKKYLIPYNAYIKVLNIDGYSSASSLEIIREFSEEFSFEFN